MINEQNIFFSKISYPFDTLELARKAHPYICHTKSGDNKICMKGQTFQTSNIHIYLKHEEIYNINYADFIIHLKAPTIIDYKIDFTIQHTIPTDLIATHTPLFGNVSTLKHFNELKTYFTTNTSITHALVIAFP